VTALQIDRGYQFGEGVDDFIETFGKKSMPLATLAKVLTEENLYGYKTINWIVKQRSRLRRKRGQK